MIFLFVTTVFIFYSDDGSCQSHKTEHTCLSETNMLSNGHQCTWLIDYSNSDTRTIESTCALNVQTSLIFIMILATLTMIVSIPLIIFYKSLLAILGSYYTESNRYSSYTTGDSVDNDLLPIQTRNQISVSHVMDTYSDLLSPEEEVDRVLDEVKKFLIEYSDIVTGISISKVAKIKAIRQWIGINADGSPSPLDFIDRLQYGSQRAKLIAKIKSVRNRTIFIKTALEKQCNNTNSKEIMLMQLFILEQFTSMKQYFLSRQMFTFPLINPSLITPVSWTCAWSFIVLSIAFFFYWILNWGLSQGGATFWLWILNFGICLSLDIFIVQSIYAYTLFVLLMKSIKSQLIKIRQVLSNIDISNKQNATDLSTEFKLLSYLSPVYRLLSRTREYAYLTSEAMFIIDDYDLFLCREDVNKNSRADKIGIYLISGFCSKYTCEIFILTISSSVIPMLIIANFYLYLLIRNFIVIPYGLILFYFIWIICSNHFYKFRSVENLDKDQTLSDSALWLKSEAPSWSLSDDISFVMSYFFINVRSCQSQLYNLFIYDKRLTHSILDIKKKNSWKLMNRPMNSIGEHDNNSVVKKIPMEEIPHIDLLRPKKNIIIENDSSMDGGYIQFLSSSAKKCLKKKGVIGFAVGQVIYRNEDFPPRENSSRVKLYRQTHICDVENNSSDVNMEDTEVLQHNNKNLDCSAFTDGVNYVKEDEKINSESYFANDDYFDQNDKLSDDLYVDNDAKGSYINITSDEIYMEEVSDGHIVEDEQLDGDYQQINVDNKRVYDFNIAEEENLSGYFIDRVFIHSDDEERHIVEFNNDYDDDDNDDDDDDNYDHVDVDVDAINNESSGDNDDYDDDDDDDDDDDIDHNDNDDKDDDDDDVDAIKNESSGDNDDIDDDDDVDDVDVDAINYESISDNIDITKMLRLLAGSDSSDDNSTLSSNASMTDNANIIDTPLKQVTSKQQLLTYEELSTSEKVEPFLSSLDKYKKLKSQSISSPAKSKSTHKSLTLSPKEKLDMLKVLVLKSDGGKEATVATHQATSELYKKLNLSNLSPHSSMIKQSESTKINTSSNILSSTSSDLNKQQLFNVTNSNSCESNSITSSDELPKKLTSMDRYQQLLKKSESLLHNFQPKNAYINRKSSIDDDDVTNKNNNNTDQNNNSNPSLLRLNKYHQLLLKPLKETDKSTYSSSLLSSKSYS